MAAAGEALARGGIEAVAVEPLARALGVTKGSFYWHFADRRALLDAVLEAWQRVGTEGIIERVEAKGGDAADRLRTLWQLASAEAGLDVEMAIRDLAARDEHVAEVVAAVDRRRMDFVRARLRELGFDAGEVEARGFACYSLIIGNHFIGVGHGRRSRRRVIADAFEILLTR
ncbi:MAG: helix-turn-helix transcriptional regulator [Sandaracinaceae bacterium]|nr:helix-turn-helix transcriptional regulator [Sandaracinaceae bacterium]